MAEQTRRARREATREEFGRAVAKRWAEDHKGTMWEWKNGTIGQLARDFGRRTEDGWQKETTKMSDAEIFETLGMVEELEQTEEATEMAEETTEQTTEEQKTEDTKMEETTKTTEEQTQAQKWEQDPRTEVREAWTRCWEYVRASRIGCCTELGEGAMELALELARALGYEEDSEEEWEQALVVLEEMDRLL